MCLNCPSVMYPVKFLGRHLPPSTEADKTFGRHPHGPPINVAFSSLLAMTNVAVCYCSIECVSVNYGRDGF